MKSLYESILGDQDDIINNATEQVKFAKLAHDFEARLNNVLLNARKTGSNKCLTNLKNVFRNLPFFGNVKVKDYSDRLNEWEWLKVTILDGQTEALDIIMDCELYDWDVHVYIYETCPERDKLRDMLVMSGYTDETSRTVGSSYYLSKSGK